MYSHGLWIAYLLRNVRRTENRDKKKFYINNILYTVHTTAGKHFKI